MSSRFNIFIKRPVLTLVINILIVVLGILGFMSMQIRLTPDADPKMITISTVNQGASASFVEENITTPLEKSLRNVSDIDRIISNSSANISNIQIIFNLNIDIDEKLNDVRDKIARVTNNLPEGTENPEVLKFDSDSFPSIWLIASSDIYSAYQMEEILDNYLIKLLNKEDSVGDVKLYGSNRYVVKIEPYLEKLYKYKISPSVIAKNVAVYNKNYAVGNIKNTSRDLSIIFDSTLNNVEEFNKILIPTPIGSVFLSELAEISFKTLPKTSIMKYNGKESLAIGIVKKPDANLISMSNRINDILPDIKNTLKNQLSIKKAFDASNFIREATSSLYRTMFEALCLVVAVMLLFLKSARATIIPAIVIPISLIGVFAVINFLGFTINLFTLLAIVLSIGLVVDDAIIVLENIYRYIENGCDPKDAAEKGLKQVVFVVIATTISLASVFIPVGFVKGFLGMLFIEFAWTIAISVLISSIVALTLTPMLAAHLLESNNVSTKPKNIIFTSFDRFFKAMSNSYENSLKYGLDHKLQFIFISIVIIICSWFLMSKIPKEFIPNEDQGFLQLYAEGSKGSNIESNLDSIQEAENVLSLEKDIDSSITILRGDSGFGFIMLNKLGERDKSSLISKRINVGLSEIAGMKIGSYEPPLLGRPSSQGSEVEFILMSDLLSYDELLKISEDIILKMKNTNLFSETFVDLNINYPSLDIKYNYLTADKYGISITNIANNLRYLRGENVISTYKRGNTSYDVILQSKDSDLENIDNFSKVYLPSLNGDMVNILNVIDIKKAITAKSYPHENGMRSVKISANLVNKNHLNKAKISVQDLMLDFVGYNLSYNFIGMIKQMDQSNAQILQVFGFALLFIYLILSAQFESFKDAGFIMFAVPFSMVGGIFSLWISGMTLNVYSNIGLVTLIGLVTKNSIMLVEFSNQLRLEKYNVKDAILGAAKLRFRPIIMTSISMIIGVMPLILASGYGAAAKNSIGVVIMGGLAIGTFFTIFLIPILYVLLNKDVKNK